MSVRLYVTIVHGPPFGFLCWSSYMTDTVYLLCTILAPECNGRLNFPYGYTLFRFLILSQYVHAHIHNNLIRQMLCAPLNVLNFSLLFHEAVNNIVAIVLDSCHWLFRKRARQLCTWPLCVTSRHRLNCCSCMGPTQAPWIAMAKHRFK